MAAVGSVVDAEEGTGVDTLAVVVGILGLAEAVAMALAGGVAWGGLRLPSYEELFPLLSGFYCVYAGY